MADESQGDKQEEPDAKAAGRIAGVAGDNRSQGGDREQKRAQFENAPSRTSKTVPILVALIALLVAVAVFVFMRRGTETPTATVVDSQARSAPSSEIRIPLSDLS